MIVFTATDTVSNRVYVGSARGDLEEHIIALVAQAEDGAEGEFFEALRKQGAECFDIDEYGFAENGAEMRELMGEAKREFGAIAIKAGRSSSVLTRPRVETSRSEVDELASLNRADSWVDDADADDDWLESRAQPESPIAAPAEVLEKKSQSSMELVKQALMDAAAEPASKPLRQAAKPQLGGEAPKPTRSLKVSKKPAKAVEKAPEKLASGRTGSANKEKRIKEAIERERAERESLREVQATREAEDMRQVMLAIEARRLEAKKQAAEKRKAEAARLKKQQSAERAAVRAAEKAKQQELSAAQEPARATLALSSRRAAPAESAAKPKLTLAALRKGTASQSAEIAAKASQLVAQVRSELDVEQARPAARRSRSEVRGDAKALAAALLANRGVKKPAAEAPPSPPAQAQPSATASESAQAQPTDMAALLARLNSTALGGARS